MMSMLPHGREDRVRKECHRRLPVELFEDRRVRPGLDEGTLAHGGALHDLADPVLGCSNSHQEPDCRHRGGGSAAPFARAGNRVGGR